HTCAGEDADELPEAIAWINNPVAAQPRPQVLNPGMVKAHRKFLQSSSLKSLPIPELANRHMTMNRRKRPYGWPPDDVAAILYSVLRCRDGRLHVSALPTSSLFSDQCRSPDARSERRATCRPEKAQSS